MKASFCPFEARAGERAFVVASARREFYAANAIFL
jgi:hypothetical protein